MDIIVNHSSCLLYTSIVELAKKCPYKVTFLGKLPQKELAKVYNSCDIFALLSFSEGLPLTVIEALACGDRVVMTCLLYTSQRQLEKELKVQEHRRM